MNNDEFDELLRARHQSFVADIDAVVRPACAPTTTRPAASRKGALAELVRSRQALSTRWIPRTEILVGIAGALCGVLLVVVLMSSGYTSDSQRSAARGSAYPSLTPSASRPSEAAGQNVVLATSVSGTVVNFAVSVKPREVPATVRVMTSHGLNLTFTTGVDEWSWAGHQNIGYAQTVTVTVTVTAGSVSNEESWTVTTPPPPPPPPTVTVSAGEACRLNSSPSCAFIVVETLNFTSDVTCVFNSDVGSAGFVMENFGPNERRQTRNYFGYQGHRVYVTCGGVQGSAAW